MNDAVEEGINGVEKGSLDARRVVGRDARVAAAGASRLKGVAVAPACDVVGGAGVAAVEGGEVLEEERRRLFVWIDGPCAREEYDEYALSACSVALHSARSHSQSSSIKKSLASACQRLHNTSVKAKRALVTNVERAAGVEAMLRAPRVDTVSAKS